MSEFMTSVAIAVSGGIASKEVITKLLGPTADYFGAGLLKGVKKGVEKTATNFARILSIATQKTGSRINEPGAVNVRVLKNVWEEGRFVEDEFSAEYFGGLLSSARSEDGRDDSAISFVALIKTLSSFQIRLHFVVYALITRHIHANDASFPFGTWRNAQLVIPANELLNAMELDAGEGQNHLVAALAGMIDNDLLGSKISYRLGDLRANDSTDALVSDDYVSVVPTERGACLFLRALGMRGVSPDVIGSMNPDYSLSNEIRSKVYLPASTTVKRLKIKDPIRFLEDRIDSKIDDLESTIMDLEGKIEELENKDTEDDENDEDDKK